MGGWLDEMKKMVMLLSALAEEERDAWGAACRRHSQRKRGSKEGSCLLFAAGRGAGKFYAVEEKAGIGFGVFFFDFVIRWDLWWMRLCIWD